jgi:drug/metabolite transporter (DMT)-like permease
LPISSSQRRRGDSLLAWYFVIAWGSGYLASKTGIQYASPFTFLALRFLAGLCLLVPIVALLRPAWPSRSESKHVLIAGLLMHAVNLGGSHYAQYLGMSASITALVLALQPLLTAFITVPDDRRMAGAQARLCGTQTDELNHIEQIECLPLKNRVDAAYNF